MYDAATSECFSFVRAMNISQKTDHHSKRKPPGASIATGSEETFPSAWKAFAVACKFLFIK